MHSESPLDGPLLHWLKLEDARRQNSNPTFVPNVPLHFDKGRFVVKTADTLAELEQSLRLRHQVFHGHRPEVRLSAAPGLDVDPWDIVCDHLIVRDRLAGRVVGSYRLLGSPFSDVFYSGTEFDLSPLLKLPDTKLELGRAAVSAEYRTGPVIQLLWRGIAIYRKMIGARYLFGCASLPTLSVRNAASAYHRLESAGHLANTLGIQPLPSHRIPNFVDQLQAVQGEDLSLSSTPIPPVVHAYLRAGARLHGEPAIDTDFGCIDFLSVLDCEATSERFERRYLT